MTIVHSSSEHQQMCQWRHWLHQHPELSYQEFLTADYIAEQLTQMGYEVHRGLGQTGVVASLQGRVRGNHQIGLRADFDGLPIDEANDFAHKSQHPGRMHACGHDGHTAMLLGAAAALRQAPDFAGCVHFIFQPAEEGGGGAQKMLEDGLLQLFPCDSIYGLHNWPGLAEGEFAAHMGASMAATTSFWIDVHGVGGHAAMPHAAVDPMVAACQMVSALQTLVSRNIAAHDSAVLSVTSVHGGSAENIIPQTVQMLGTLRYYRDEVGAVLRQRMQELVAGLAAGFAVRADVRFEAGYPATINDADEARLCAQVAAESSGVPTHVNLPPSTGAEDFAYFLEQRPGAYLWLGAGAQKQGCGLHNPGYDFNDNLLPVGVNYWLELVKRRLPMT